MAKIHGSWTVLPHMEIQELADNLWRVQGSLEGMALRRVMTIARRDDGQLVIHNGIALDEDSMARIEAWGKPTTIIVPNAYHRLDAPAFADRYPEAKVLCPSGAVDKVRSVVRVDGVYADFPSDDAISLAEIEGVAGGEGVMTVRSADGTTLVFNDLIFNMPHGKGIAGFIFRHITQSTGGPRISRVVRWFVMKDGTALRAHLERLAETPDLRRIIVSHHRVIDEDPAAVLKAVAATL